MRRRACCATLLVGVLLVLSRSAGAETCIDLQATRTVGRCAPLDLAVEAAAPRGRLGPRPYTQAQATGLGQLHRRSCDLSLPEITTIRAQRAASFVEHRRWALAAAALRQLAFDPRAGAVAERAVVPYLAALDVLGGRLEPARPQCYDLMEKDVEQLARRHCPQLDPPMAGDHCRKLRRIQHDIERLQLEQLTKQADAGGRTKVDRQRLYARIGRGYVDLWRRFGEPACRAGTAACRGKDEVLYQAGRAYRAAGQPRQAQEVFALLRRPAYHFGRRAIVAQATYHLAAIHDEGGESELAARWYERYAREWPQASRGSDALVRAVELRLALAQRDRARSLARLLLRQASGHAVELQRLRGSQAVQTALAGRRSRRATLRVAGSRK